MGQTSKERKRTWEKNNRERIRAAAKARYEAIKADPVAWAEYVERRDAYYRANKDKFRKAGKKHYHRNKARITAGRYGLTEEQYAAMLTAQGGACAICGSTKTGRKDDRPFCLDHDHATGQVRALLCWTCNLTVGHAHEDPTRLRAAADYLERFARRAAA